jgi:4-hydroxybenzoate polyprenyltransferase
MSVKHKWTLKGIIWELVQVILYSNTWIALAAVALSLQTEYALTGVFQVRALHFFIFSATLFVYSTHRLVALKKLESKNWQERFFYISKAQRWIFSFAVLAVATAGILFLNLPSAIQIAIIVPGILSLAYVFPVLKGNKRIRDIHYLKIFLIALVWAWVTVGIPAIDLGLAPTMASPLMALERLLFIFAITLPFDIRDLLLDHQQAVKTLPGTIGLLATRRLATLVLVAMLLSIGVLYSWNIYTIGQSIALLISSTLAFVLIYKAHPQRPDYYFTGYLDGTMILQFLLFYLM